MTEEYEINDYIWYNGPYLSNGLYYFRGICSGHIGSMGNSRVNIGTIKPHKDGFNGLYEVWASEIRKATKAEIALYSNNGLSRQRV